MLASEYSEFPLIKLVVGGLHPLHWGRCEFCVCLHRFVRPKISWTKFNLSKATKEAITKNQSLHMATNKGTCINSKPNVKPVILLLGCKAFLHQGNIDCEYLGIYSSILFLCMYNWYTLENKLYKYILYLILYPIFHNTVAYSYVMKYSLETKFVNTAS